MRRLLFIAFFLSALTLSGQINNFKVPQVVTVNPGVLKIDTEIRVTYFNRNSSEKQPAYYLNGQFVSSTILKTLDPKSIDNINVDYKLTAAESQKYYGRILLTTKKGFKPRLISLTDLKLKYTTLKKKPVLFMIDDEIINDDYDKFFVDENYILRISIESIDRVKAKLRFDLIRILTKSEENIMNSKQIRLRGTSQDSYY